MGIVRILAATVLTVTALASCKIPIVGGGSDGSPGGCTDPAGCSPSPNPSSSPQPPPGPPPLNGTVWKGGCVVDGAYWAIDTYTFSSTTYALHRDRWGAGGCPGAPTATGNLTFTYSFGNPVPNAPGVFELNETMTVNGGWPDTPPIIDSPIYDVYSVTPDGTTLFLGAPSGPNDGTAANKRYLLDNAPGDGYFKQ